MRKKTRNASFLSASSSRYDLRQCFHVSRSVASIRRHAQVFRSSRSAFVTHAVSSRSAELAPTVSSCQHTARRHARGMVNLASWQPRSVVPLAPDSVCVAVQHPGMDFSGAEVNGAAPDPAAFLGGFTKQ